jgi:hypothetical protein
MVYISGAIGPKLGNQAENCGILKVMSSDYFKQEDNSGLAGRSYFCTIDARKSEWPVARHRHGQSARSSGRYATALVIFVSAPE